MPYLYRFAYHAQHLGNASVGSNLAILQTLYTLWHNLSTWRQNGSI